MSRPSSINAKITPPGIIICTSLFGSHAKYRGGALQSAQEIEGLKGRFPGLALVIYYDKTVPTTTVSALSSFPHVELVYVDSPWAGVGTLPSTYRFFGFQDYQTAHAIVTYDLDNKIDSDFFFAMIENALQGDSVFYLLKKRNPPRGRPLNADCWIAVPGRSLNFLEICTSLTSQLLDFVRTMNDISYGCDERILKFIVEDLRKYHCPESRIYRFYSERLPGTSAEIVHYDDTQRQPMAESQLTQLEQHLADKKNPPHPQRQVILS